MVELPPNTSDYIKDESGALNFRLRVPAASVSLQSGLQTLSYEVGVFPLSAKGEPMPGSKAVRLDLTGEQTDEALAKGWGIDQPLVLSGSVRAVKFVVMDNSSGKVGSVIVPVNK